MGLIYIQKKYKKFKAVEDYPYVDEKLYEEMKFKYMPKAVKILIGYFLLILGFVYYLAISELFNDTEMVVHCGYATGTILTLVSLFCFWYKISTFKDNFKLFNRNGNLKKPLRVIKEYLKFRRYYKTRNNFTKQLKKSRNKININFNNYKSNTLILKDIEFNDYVLKEQKKLMKIFQNETNIQPIYAIFYKIDSRLSYLLQKDYLLEDVFNWYLKYHAITTKSKKYITESLPHKLESLYESLCEIESLEKSIDKQTLDASKLSVYKLQELIKEL